MKKILIILFTIFCFSIIGDVKANTIYSIQTDVIIDKNGNGHITEIWEVDANEGTEIYHSFGNLEDRSIVDFHVTMDGKDYSNIGDWDVDATKQTKAYKNGINYINNGLELCWGVEYGLHVYEVTYTVTNIVYEYEDNQILYFAFLPQNMRTPPQEFKLTVTTDELLKEIKYSSYGFKSENKIIDGSVVFESTERLLSTDYVVALVGFPLKTFDLSIKKEGIYNDIANEALKGAYSNTKTSIKDVILPIIMFIVSAGIIGIIIRIIVNVYHAQAKYENDFVLPSTKETNNFRDIPFDKKFLLAYFIAIRKNLFIKNNLIGAYLLKWIKTKKIKMVPTKSEGILDFNKNDNYYFDLTELNEFDDEIEEKLINYLKKAADNELKLTPKNFSNWSKNNYQKILDLLTDAEKYSKQLLIDQKYIIEKEEMYGKKAKTRKLYVFTKKLEEETIRLQGLKKFLNDMSLIDEKKAIEVHIWEEYLIFAQVFGNADKVAKQFKDFHNTVYKNNTAYYDNLFAVHVINTSFMNSVSANSSSASGGSFSGGGMSSGGFSSGGGGVR